MMTAFHLATWGFSTQSDEGTSWQVLCVICIFLFVFSFAATWGPIPWVYQGEVFPLRVRVKGSTVGTLSNYLNNWIIAFVVPALMKVWSTKTFILFAGAMLLAWVFSQFYVIETKGLNLEEMDAKMGGIKNEDKKIEENNKNEEDKKDEKENKVNIYNNDNNSKEKVKI